VTRLRQGFGVAGHPDYGEDRIALELEIKLGLPWAKRSGVEGASSTPRPRFASTWPSPLGHREIPRGGAAS
jgi:hypothetical protein